MSLATTRQTNSP